MVFKPYYTYEVLHRR